MGPAAVALLSTADVAVAAPAFLIATAVVVVVAPRLTSIVDEISARTTLGASLAGSLLLGASTSLPGIVVTVVATLRGEPALAAANAVGGVVAQTTFIAVADVASPGRNVVRRDVSAKALTQTSALLVSLAVPLFAVSGWPDVSVGGVHPASAVLVAVYAAGVTIARRAPGASTSQETSPDLEGSASMRRLWARYAVSVVLVGVAGYVIGTAISPIAESLGLTSLAAGALVTAGVTSSPELVTAVTAARRGQLQLAVGDIVGGNSFDILFLVVADVALAASLYGQVGSGFTLLVAAAILLNGLILLGFVREGTRRTVSGESILVVLLYLVLALALVLVPPG